MNPWTNEVGTAYFRTLGLPLVAGREFDERDSDGAPLVAIINRAFAACYCGNESPVGRRFGFRSMDNPGAIEIVGVVGDSIYAEMRQGTGDEHETPRLVYTPFAQSTELNEMTVYVRTAGRGNVSDELRRVVARADPSMPLFEMQSMEQTVDEALFNERMLALLSASFGLLATLLAAIGLYGVLAYTVAQRTREIGLRMALGAEPGRVRRMVLRQVGWMTLVGGAIGLVVAIWVGSLAKSLLYELEGSDPFVLAASSVVLTLVALCAGSIPALRASRVDPMTALRYE
jgi:predicted permease